VSDLADGTRACGANRVAAKLEAAPRARRPLVGWRPTLTEAIALYRSEGYVEVPAFNDEPFAHHWFEKMLP
jgi:hypothetical protein